MIPSKAIDLAHHLLVDKLAVSRGAIDATAGNGHDTLFLARHTPEDAVVWAFDLQPAALATTTKRLNEQGLAGKCRLVAACHSLVAAHVTGPVDVAMFNLGYLPGGDHHVTTKADTSVAAIGNTLTLLEIGGLTTIVTYPGHPAGNIENMAVAEYLAALPQAAFTVACWRMLNQRNQPPVLYIVEKIGSESA